MPVLRHFRMFKNVAGLAGALGGMVVWTFEIVGARIAYTYQGDGVAGAQAQGASDQ